MSGALLSKDESQRQLFAKQGTHTLPALFKT